MSLYLRILPLAFLLCLCTFPLRAQTGTERVTLSLASDSLKKAEITVTEHNSVRYMTADDLARFIAARTFSNPVLKKIELILPSIRFKCTADNPFVIITNQTGGAQSVYQLTSPVLYADGVYSLPLSDFLALYEARTHERIIAGRKGGEGARASAAPSGTQSDQISLGTTEKSAKYSITGIDVEEKRNGFLIRIHASQRLPDAERVLQGGQWLYLTIPKAKADVAALGGIFQTGIVKRLIPLQSAEGLQLSFQLREKVESAEVIQNNEDTDILVALRMAPKEENSAAPAEGTESTPKNGNEAEPTKKASEPREGSDAAPALNVPGREDGSEGAARKNDSKKESASLKSDAASERQPSKRDAYAERQRNKWKLDVVVLDAGHGGHDPGTIGSRGTYEKDVTLGIALKLGKLIERNMPGVKVVYTRKSDQFVELYRRGQIANEAGGKLFISIHCNSTPKKATAANGFEIYLLRPGKTENAIAIAEQENSVVRLEKGYENRYQKLTDENFIILTMAQSAYVKQSERFAEILEGEMAKKMVYQSRGVKQAGFYVLVGASMPNILVETGYLSNRKDETLLRGLAGQYLAAESIFDGLKKFKSEYEQKYMAD